jgi:hypothetical protein
MIVVKILGFIVLGVLAVAFWPLVLVAVLGAVVYKIYRWSVA